MLTLVVARHGVRLLQSRLLLLVVAVLLVAVVVAIPRGVPQAHAAITGTVCVADPTSATPTSPCPGAPPSFDGPTTTPATQIRIGVFIQGSDAINGFDVTLKSESTILRPAGADLTGTVLPGQATIIVECLDGVLVSGSTCATTDTLGTLHFAATAGLGLSTTAPTTGLLFTAIYNITRLAPSGGISLDYQTGCTGTSVSGGVCVTMSNGTLIPVPEIVQGGSFNNFTFATDLPYVTISANTTSVGPVFPGIGRAVNITATGQNGWPGFGTSGVVTFSFVATSGLQVSLSRNSCDATAWCNITLSLSVASTGSPGNYFVTVFTNYAAIDSATFSTNTLAAPVTILFVVQDFTLAVSPGTVSFNSGQTNTATATLTSLNGFDGNVTLSATISPLTGLTVSFNPVSVRLTPGGSSTSTITFSSSTAGPYTVTVKGTNVTRVKTATLTVRVADFSVVASPTIIGQLNANATGTSTITVTAISGFSGVVTLTNSTSTGLSCNLSTTSLTLPPSPATTTLTCKATAAGSYTVTVTGISSSLSHTTATITFNVVDFTISTSVTSLGPLDANATATSTITIGALNGFAGTVTLSTSQPLSLIVSLSQNTVTGSGTSVLTVRGLVAGNYTVLVTGANGGLSHSVAVSVKVWDFIVEAPPGTLTVPRGSSGSLAVTLGSLNGFVGTVTLTLSVSPSGPIVSLAPYTSLLLKAGGANTTTLRVDVGASVTPGNYIVNVTAARDTLTDFVLVILTVPTPDFTITASPLSLVPSAGASGISTVTVAAQNGFTGTVALTVSSAQGLTCQPLAGITGGSGASTLSCSATAAGDYSVVVTGTSGSLSHTAPSITFHVVDFTISASPTGLTIDTGVSGTSTITLSALNGFSGTVALAVTPPSGLTATLSTSTITASGTSTLTVSASEAGTYTVTISGGSGSLSHSVSVTVSVSTPPARIIGLEPAQFYSLVGVLVVIAVVGTVLVLRGRRPKPK